MRTALLSFCLLAACATAQKPPVEAKPADSKATDLNSIARADYAEARGRAIAHAGPVLVVGPSQITFIDGQKRQQFELAPPAFHQLKTVAHLPLGLHSLFFQQTPPREKLLELRAAAEKTPLPEPRDRQQRIIALSTGLIDDALAGHADLPRYEREVAPLLLENALDAARMEIADLDAATAEVRKQTDLSKLHVVIVGAHMAREGEISQHYFEKLLGEREGLHIVFAEGLWDEPSELSLLGTHLLDSSVGEGFFGDPRRMHRDLLSDAAKKLLDGR
ncbi:MAG TPA: hypothetical protein VH083_25550 [Myxococcales bacterium]|jgi:hypothetical protein|nr:hypothetical protein [Myxococcales bacterium]